MLMTYCGPEIPLKLRILNGDQNLKSISTGETGKYSRVIDYEPMADIILIASDNSLTAVNKNPPYNIVTTFESASIKSLSSNSVNSFAIAMSSGVEVFTKKATIGIQNKLLLNAPFVCNMMKMIFTLVFYGYRYSHNDSKCCNRYRYSEFKWKTYC